MGGKFNIDGDFNVFDEWGTFKGKFSPSSGGSDGIFMILTFILVGAIGFAIYAVFKMSVAGFKALTKHEWPKAVMYLSPIWISLILLMIGIFMTVILTVKTSVNLNEASKYITIENVKTSCNGWFGYDVVNRWDRPVHVWSILSLLKHQCTGDVISSTDFPNRGMTLNPGERVTIYTYPIAGDCAADVDIGGNNYLHLLCEPKKRN